MEPLRRRISRARLERHHANFFHVRSLEVVRLDLLGIHIFSISEDDDFLASPGDEKIAAGIEVAQITGIEPSVAKDLGRSLGAIPISLHDDRAADRNLA